MASILELLEFFSPLKTSPQSYHSLGVTFRFKQISKQNRTTETPPRPPWAWLFLGWSGAGECVLEALSPSGAGPEARVPVTVGPCAGFPAEKRFCQETRGPQSRAWLLLDTCPLPPSGVPSWAGYRLRGGRAAWSTGRVHLEASPGMCSPGGVGGSGRNPQCGERRNLPANRIVSATDVQTFMRIKSL